MNRFLKTVLPIGITFFLAGPSLAQQPAPEFKLAHFSADVTIPLNHRCMGVLPTKSKKIVDRLYAHGLVLLGKKKPIVFCAVDWCEIRNGSYEKWRTALAQAAGTSKERVIVSALHQHDAPVADEDAARLLREVGLAGEIRPVQRGEERLREAAKLGFKRALIPKGNKISQKISGLEIIPLLRIEDLVTWWE